MKAALFVIASLVLAGVHGGIDFTIQVCSRPGACVEEQAAIVTSYEYTGCSDPKACTWVINHY